MNPRTATKSAGLRITLITLISIAMQGLTTPHTAIAMPASAQNHCPATAADRYGWGAPNRVSNFSDPSALADWQIYDTVGHAGNGRRTPAAVDASNGALTITGNPNGDSAGLSWRPGQTYGRWEVCMKSTPASPNYHSVALLWPDSDRWPDDGEIDFMEILDPARQIVTATVIKYDWQDPNLKQFNYHIESPIDATQWHSWAVEWTPTHVVGYVDGNSWFETSKNIIPTGPMHLCLQLDNFGGDTSDGGQQFVESAQQYSLTPS